LRSISRDQLCALIDGVSGLFAKIPEDFPFFHDGPTRAC
jgi:hypothetical protein